MFPDIQFDAYDLNAEPWQIFDSRNRDKVGEYVLSLARHTREVWNSLYGASDSRIPDTDCIQRISEILRGDFECVPVLYKQIHDTEQRIVHVTHEQLHCLDQMADNPRCLIHGGAGTGKTLMALEQLRRSALKGERVGLFCYNTSLGIWLKDRVARMGLDRAGCFVGTLHSLMAQYAAPKAHKSDEVFYSEVMPSQAYENMKQMSPWFDRIIVDEVQDLLQPQYLKVLDVCLSGGLAQGHWDMFGDFNRQAIYTEDMSLHKAVALLQNYAAFAICRLIVNCRNTKNIIEDAAYITRMSPSECLHNDIAGMPVSYMCYGSKEEQVSALLKLLDHLKAEGVLESDVTILSPRRREISAVPGIANRDILPYVPGSNSAAITFSTIQAFKGLENSVIVLTDIESYSNTQLLYVGFSRARSMLFVLESTDAFEERKLLLRRTVS
jgi:hypothetical protein